MDITRILARRLVESRYEDIPQAVRHEAARPRKSPRWCGRCAGRTHATSPDNRSTWTAADGCR